MKKILAFIVSVFMLVCSFQATNIYADQPLGSGGGGVGGDYKYPSGSVGISQVGNQLHITCDDDAFLSALCEKGILTLSYLMGNSGDFVVNEFKSYLPSIQEIKKAEGYAYVDNIDSILYNSSDTGHNTYYRCSISGVNGYYDYGYIGEVSIANCLERGDYPGDISIEEIGDGVIKISSSSTDYIDSIYEVDFFGTGFDIHTWIYKTGLSVSDDHMSITMTLGDSNISNGDVPVMIYSTKYKEYEGQTTFEKRSLKPCPDFNASLNDNGDMIITSDDTDWINGLCEIRPDSVFTITGEYIEGTYGEPGYKFSSFSTRNWKVTYMSGNESVREPFTKVDSNTVSFSAFSQRNNTYSGQCLSGINYSYTLTSKGYEVSGEKNIEFTNAAKFFPDSLTFKFVGEMVILQTDNLEFMNYLKQFDDFSAYDGFFSTGDFSAKILHINCYKYESEPSWQLNELCFINDNTVGIDISNCGISNDYFTNGVYLDLDTTYFDNNMQYLYSEDLYAGPWTTYNYDDSKSVKSTVEQYNVTFNGNGGSGDMDPVQIGGYYPLPENEFSAPASKEFLGWQVGDDTTVRFADERVVIFGDKVIKALWKDIPVPTVVVSDSQIEVGKITNATPNDNESKASLVGSVDSLIPESDKAAGAAVWLEVNPIDNTSDDYSRMERGFALENSGELMECMEINVFKKVKGQDAEKVSETETDAIISFDLTGKPELIALAENRQLFVYNIHEGRVSDIIVPLSYDVNTHIFTFKASQFSIYGFFKMGDPNPINPGGSGESSRHYVLNTGIN